MKPAGPLGWCMGWCMSVLKVRAGECRAHLAANLHTHLLCHALGYRDGSHTPGLCDSNAPTLQACTCQPKACQVVGQSTSMWAARGGSGQVKQQITLAMPDSRRNWGSCVDFPLPVSPTSIVVSCVRMSCRSSWRTSAIGRRFDASCKALRFLPLACSDMNHNSAALALALV